MASYTRRVESRKRTRSVATATRAVVPSPKTSRTEEEHETEPLQVERPLELEDHETGTIVEPLRTCSDASTMTDITGSEMESNAQYIDALEKNLRIKRERMQNSEIVWMLLI